MPRRLPVLVLAVALLAALLLPAGALAADLPQNPLSPALPLVQSTPTVTQPVATAPASTTSSSSGGSFSGTDAIFVAAGAIIILGGISLFIWRDARRRAPQRSRAAAATAGAGGARTGSKPRPKSRKPSPAERRRRKRGRAR